MRRTFIIEKNDKTRNCITVHPAIVQELQLYNIENPVLKFGTQQTKVIIKTSRQLNENNWLLSTNLINKLHIPLSPTYEITILNNEINIGPFIGILIGNSDEELKKRLPHLLDYVYSYPKINGMIVTFSAEQIQPSKPLINGYFYDHIDKLWKQGKFHYPSAILLRTILTPTRRKLLQKAVGNRIINSHVYNKWECYQAFAPLKEYIPNTYLYSEPTQIFSLLKQYNSLYIKPINSYGGQKICKVLLDDNQDIKLVINKKHSNKTITFNTKDRAIRYFRRLLIKDKWILQEPINMISSNDCLIDFRCIVIKGKNGKWGIAGIIGRYGPPSSIVSNIHAGGRAEMGMKTLMKTLKFTKQESILQLRKISRLALEAVQLLEARGGHFGTTGVDIGMDKNRNLWLIEVNHRFPAHNIALDAGNSKLYYRITKKIMVHLKELAGF
ncbi:YheC/YheD family endospore coat-associated protein [Bacillus sp. Marseille-P3661]|uniref:YheC/YheD family endospore coat-associated protein n=1 Tax=Bacillus sp. Marseille-P3661 TaxID=1936234 RepID=UPI000C816556|nr:YheC/YheD family protein [Bacillus sp. Marseille-P3661]